MRKSVYLITVVSGPQSFKCHPLCTQVAFERNEEKSKLKERHIGREAGHRGNQLQCNAHFIVFNEAWNNPIQLPGALFLDRQATGKVHLKGDQAFFGHLKKTQGQKNSSRKKNSSKVLKNSGKSFKNSIICHLKTGVFLL